MCVLNPYKVKFTLPGGERQVWTIYAKNREAAKTKLQNLYPEAQNIVIVE